MFFPNDQRIGSGNGNNNGGTGHGGTAHGGTAHGGTSHGGTSHGSNVINGLNSTGMNSTSAINAVNDINGINGVNGIYPINRLNNINNINNINSINSLNDSNEYGCRRGTNYRFDRFNVWNINNKNGNSEKKKKEKEKKRRKRNKQAEETVKMDYYIGAFNKDKLERITNTGLDPTICGNMSDINNNNNNIDNGNSINNIRGSPAIRRTESADNMKVPSLETLFIIHSNSERAKFGETYPEYSLVQSFEQFLTNNEQYQHLLPQYKLFKDYKLKTLLQGIQENLANDDSGSQIRMNFRFDQRQSIQRNDSQGAATDGDMKTGHSYNNDNDGENNNDFRENFGIAHTGQNRMKLGNRNGNMHGNGSTLQPRSVLSQNSTRKELRNANYNHNINTNRINNQININGGINGGINDTVTAQHGGCDMTGAGGSQVYPLLNNFDTNNGNMQRVSSGRTQDLRVPVNQSLLQPRAQRNGTGHTNGNPMSDNLMISDINTRRNRINDNSFNINELNSFNTGTDIGTGNNNDINFV